MAFFVGESVELAFPEWFKEGELELAHVFCVLLPFSLVVFHCIMGWTAGSYGLLPALYPVYISTCLDFQGLHLGYGYGGRRTFALACLCYMRHRILGLVGLAGKAFGNSGAGCVGVASVRRVGRVLILARWQVFHRLVCLLHGVGVALWGH